MRQAYLSLLAILLVIFIAKPAEAHGRLDKPAGRTEHNRDTSSGYWNDPVPGNNEKFVCRGSAQAAPYWEVTAGTSTNIKWTFSAPHVGDVNLYFTYDLDADKPDTQKRWFKFAEIFEAKNYNNQDYTIEIPSYLPQCDHCIFRWEWYALHNAPSSVEYYVACVDVKINSNVPANGPLPTPQVTVPGHLPSFRNPYSGGNQFISGPPIATVSGSPPPPPPPPPTSAPPPPPTSAPPPPPTSAPPPPPTSTPPPATSNAPPSGSCHRNDWKGDGYCDGQNNNAGCEWDGGDCCQQSCTSGRRYTCGSSPYVCEDPAYSTSEPPTPPPSPPSPPPSADPVCHNDGWRQDGYCDEANNVAACFYDGGDCCSSTCVQGGQYNCGYNGYDCQDPNGSNSGAAKEVIGARHDKDGEKEGNGVNYDPLFGASTTTVVSLFAVFGSMFVALMF